MAGQPIDLGTADRALHLGDRFADTSENTHDTPEVPIVSDNCANSRLWRAPERVCVPLGAHTSRFAHLHPGSEL